MRMLSVLVALTLAWAPAAVAQAQPPSSVFQGVVMALALADGCSVPIAAEERHALAAAGGKLAVQLGVGPDDMDKLRAAAADDVKERAANGGCDESRRTLDALVADLLVAARQY